MRRLVPLLALVLLAGCAQPVAGSPAPVSDPAPTTAAAPELPPRPRDVPLDGVDPCTLLTESDRAELGLDQPPILDVGLSALYGGETRLCSIRGFEPRVISLGVELSVTGGIELFFRPGVRSEVTPVEVAGFPAVLARPTTGIQDFCTVVIDVADGQAVDIQVANAGGEPPMPQPELCDTAERAAGFVMGNLLAQR